LDIIFEGLGVIVAEEKSVSKKPHLEAPFGDGLPCSGDLMGIRRFLMS